MPQTSVDLRQPAWLGEGQLADTAVRRIEGAMQNYPNGVAGMLPFGRVVVRNAQGQAVLPSAAATATNPIIGVSVLNEKYGIPLSAAIAATNAPTGYPQGPNVLVDVMAFGDIVMQTEEAIAATDVGAPVFYRFAGGTAPNNVVGRVRKAAVASEAEILPNAKFITASAAGGLVVVRIGSVGGATVTY